MRIIKALTLCLLFTFCTFAQDKFTEGKIVMTQTMSTDNEQMKGMLATYLGDGPILMTTYVKGDKSRAEMNSATTGEMITISDVGKSEMLMLMDNPMIGKKYSLTLLNKENEEKLKDNVSVVKGTETKTVLGYECLRHDVKINQDGIDMTMVMYVTDKIVPVMSQQTAMLVNEIDGFPMYMEIDMNQQGMAFKMTFEVTEMSEEAVPDSKFDMTPPEGYTKIDGM